MPSHAFEQIGRGSINIGFRRRTVQPDGCPQTLIKTSPFSEVIVDIKYILLQHVGFRL